MAVIIKDFQVVNEQPDNQAMAPTAGQPPNQEQSKGTAPPPKKIVQTLAHIKQRLSRIHAD